MHMGLIGKFIDWIKSRFSILPKTEPQEPIKDMDQLIKSLIYVESMLCQSACIAEDKYSNDAEHLIKIIKNQHLGIESVLERIGVECKRSQVGAKFSPEVMEASENYIITNDKTMDGKVATCEIPGFCLGDKILAFERVKLYYYKE
jgi:molecular chaperone GrpE (heat shock protein)